MNDARAVVGMDRLPWLMDEPKPQARANRGARELLGWAVAGFVMVAGISYWMGVETGRSGQDAITTSAETPRSTVKLPEPRAIAPEVPLPAVPEVRLAPDRIVAIPEPRAEKPVRPRRTSSTKRKLSPMRLDKSKLADTVTRQRARKQSTAHGTAGDCAQTLAGNREQGRVRTSRADRRLRQPSAGEARLAAHATGLSGRGAASRDRRRRPQLARS
jgi:hypothetical protein